MASPKRVQMGIRTTRETAQQLKNLADTASVSTGEALTWLLEKHAHLGEHAVVLEFSEAEWTAFTMVASAHKNTPERHLKKILLSAAKEELLQAAKALETTQAPRKKAKALTKNREEAPAEPSSSDLLNMMLGAQ